MYYQSCENLDSFTHTFIGGELVKTDNGTFMAGQMYTEIYVPKNKTKEYPIVLMHGAWATGAVCWQQTPDGRAGWLDSFLREGYTVYIIDQPSRGRSCIHTDMEGERSIVTLEAARRIFTGQVAGNYSYSDKHTQWPGSEEDFLRFYASQVESLYSAVEGQTNMRNVAKALFELTGPCILLGHSQAGPFTWILANDCPDMVKGYIRIEPQGPSFCYDDPQKAYVDENGDPKNWGVSQIPVEYDPPVTSSRELKIEKLISPDTDHIDGFRQAKPARKLKNLTHIPALMLTGEASYHTSYDYITAYNLRQAGVPLDYINLGDIGIHGNGHYMFMEKNSNEIFEFVKDWLENNI